MLSPNNGCQYLDLAGRRQAWDGLTAYSSLVVISHRQAIFSGFCRLNQPTEEAPVVVRTFRGQCPCSPIRNPLVNVAGMFGSEILERWRETGFDPISGVNPPPNLPAPLPP